MRGVASAGMLSGLAASLWLFSSAASASPPWPALELLGTAVAPGEKRQLSLLSSESFAGTSLPTPVVVIRGTRPGPTLCLTAGIHGDEINGVEIVRRIIEQTQPEKLRGTVLAVPIANLHGFRRSSRYLPDRRDLNRYFPGHPKGSSASRIANAIFEGVIRHCAALVDLHTGSFHRTNLPQARANLTNPAVVDLALAFGAATVVHSSGIRGTLRRAATEAGIPAITFEAGEPMRFDRAEVKRGVQGIGNVLEWLGMLEDAGGTREAQRVYYRSRWVRVDDGGILLARVSLGDRVQPGEVLGTVTDPISNERTVIRASQRARVIGMALDQVVIPGFAAFHLGLEASPEEGARPSPEEDESWQTEVAEEAPSYGADFELEERPE